MFGRGWTLGGNYLDWGEKLGSSCIQTRKRAPRLKTSSSQRQSRHIRTDRVALFTPWQRYTIQYNARPPFEELDLEKDNFDGIQYIKGQLWVKVFLLFQRVLQLQFHRFRLQLTLTLWHWHKAGRWLKTKTTLMPLPFQINQYILIYRQCTDDLICCLWNYILWDQSHQKLWMV